MVFHCWIHNSRKNCFKSSHLCYADTKLIQYQAIVKLLGSFRLTAGNRHLHRYCIFTELLLETVSQSLRHSCTSELTRQGITLFYSSKKDSIFTRFLAKMRVRGVGLLPTTYGLSTHYGVLGSPLIVIINLFYGKPYNSPSPSRLDLRPAETLRTVIVTADIHQGLYQPAHPYGITTNI